VVFMRLLWILSGGKQTRRPLGGTRRLTVILAARPAGVNQENRLIELVSQQAIRKGVRHRQHRYDRRRPLQSTIVTGWRIAHGAAQPNAGGGRCIATETAAITIPCFPIPDG
jgi:hypothetical protein